MTHVRLSVFLLSALLMFGLMGCGDGGMESIEITEVPSDGQSQHPPFMPWSSSSMQAGNVCITILGDQSDCDGNYGYTEDYYKMSNAHTQSSSSITLGENMILDSRNNGVYRLVYISKQTWLAENMLYRNPKNTQSTLIFDKTFGAYYTHDAALEACPEGWRLPSAGEWAFLLYEMADPRYEAGDIYYTMAGNMLKSKETWEGRDRGSDALEFGALAAGVVENDVQFDEGHVAEFWTSTESVEGYSKVVRIVGNDNYAVITDRKNSDAVSVRCVTGEVFEMSLSSSSAASSSSVASSSSELSEIISDTLLLDKRDSSLYELVRIDSLYWMAQNLRYEMDGTYCGTITNDDEADCEKYGRVYSWAMAEEACPDGWRIPRQSEFKDLLDQITHFDRMRESFAPTGYVLDKVGPSNVGSLATYWIDLPKDMYVEVWQHYVLYSVEDGETDTASYAPRNSLMTVRCVREAE